MFDAGRVRQSWARESAAIDAVVTTINEHTAAEAIRPDGWTTHDLLGHIASAARAFLVYTRGERSDQVDVDAANARQLERGRQRSWTDVLAYWQHTRDEIAAFLADTTDEQGDEPANLPWLPDITTKGEALRVLILHTRSHRQELERGFPDVQA